MRRSTRADLARQTVEIIERGSYQLADGATISVADAVEACLRRTSFHSPEELKKLRREVLAAQPIHADTVMEVRNETTLAGIARLLAMGDEPVAALNFASARNPGGGFLNGSQAQEESLARSSALYASLLRAPEYYDCHRREPSCLYSDAMILSPDCPIIRDDEGELLPKPLFASFIASAAPNLGATANNHPEELDRIPEVFERRAEYVLALAAAHGYRRLVLGAWGCGVFRNDPELVAGVFANHLRGVCSRRFSHVVFSVLDSSAEQEIFVAFQRALSGA